LDGALVPGGKVRLGQRLGGTAAASEHVAT
jgi:hypothetical protein